ncbi:MAG: hypothetical protein IJE76_03170 [Bacteroidales bacterium]|nr:hypothetical protein [Bacteroidales bacterium]
MVTAKGFVIALCTIPDKVVQVGVAAVERLYRFIFSQSSYRVRFKNAFV